jgi:hypothetical protein
VHRSSIIVGALLLVGGGAMLSGCGSSTSTSSSGGSVSSGSSSSVPGSISVAGGPFCTQVASVISQFAQLGAAFQTAPGATPNVNTFKQLIATEAQVIDQLDSSAPGEIASAFHTLRSAIDQANSQVQSATTFAQIGAAFSSFSSSAVTTANTAITNYFKNSCGISSSTST